MDIQKRRVFEQSRRKVVPFPFWLYKGIKLQLLIPLSIRIILSETFYSGSLSISFNSFSLQIFIGVRVKRKLMSKDEKVHLRKVSVI